MRSESHVVNKKMNKNNFSDLRKQGNEWYSKGQYDKAILSYTRALEKTSTEKYIILSNRASAFSQLGQWENSFLDSSESVQEKPNWIKGYYRQGISLLAMRKPTQAQTVFEKALHLNPDSFIIQKLLEECDRVLHILNQTKDDVDAGTVYSWGCNNLMQLGLGPTQATDSMRCVPGQLEILRNVVVIEVFSGSNNVFALTNQGDVYGWGDNSQGQVGVGTSKCIQRPTLLKFPDGESVTQISCGNKHCLALTARQNIYAWGTGYFGQQSLEGSPDTPLSYPTPTLITCVSNSHVQYVGAGGNHSFVILKGGQVLSIGENYYGQLGLGHSSDEEATWKTCKSLSRLDVKMIACGDEFSVGVTSEGRLFLWGYNSNGQLGQGDTSTRYEPTPLSLSSHGNLPIVDVSCGKNFVAALNSIGDVYIWGQNSGGQCGVSPISMAHLMTPVKLCGPNFTQISCGESHILAVKHDDDCGEVYSCGRGDPFVVGSGGGTDFLKKVENLNDISISMSAAGKSHSIVASGCRKYQRQVSPLNTKEIIGQSQVQDEEESLVTIPLNPSTQTTQFEARTSDVKRKYDNDYSRFQHIGDEDDAEDSGNKVTFTPLDFSKGVDLKSFLHT